MQGGTADLGREAWLLERRSYLGGTDFAKLLGASEWGGPIDVWLDKVKGVRTPGKWIMDLGNHLEASVAQLWADRTGLALLKPDPSRHPEFDFIGGNPDFLPVERQDLGLEIKTASSWGLQKAGKWGEDGSDIIPIDYWVQSQIYMGLTGRTSWDLAAAFYDVALAERLWRVRDRMAADVLLASVMDDFRVYHLTFDADFFAMAVEEGVQFWMRYVEPFAKHGIEIVPPTDGALSSLAREWMLGKVAAGAPKVFEADEATEILLASYAQADAAEKAAKAQKGEARTALEQVMATQGCQELVGTTHKLKLYPGKEEVSENPEAVIQALADSIGLAPDALAALRLQHSTTSTKAPSTRLTAIKPKKGSQKGSAA